MINCAAKINLLPWQLCCCSYLFWGWSGRDRPSFLHHNRWEYSVAWGLGERFPLYEEPSWPQLNAKQHRSSPLVKRSKITSPPTDSIVLGISKWHDCAGLKKCPLIFDSLWLQYHHCHHSHPIIVCIYLPNMHLLKSVMNHPGDVLTLGQGSFMVGFLF